jgi:hypothetical protein
VVGWVGDQDGAEPRVQLAMNEGQLGYVRLKPSIRIPAPEDFVIQAPLVEDGAEDDAADE